MGLLGAIISPVGHLLGLKDKQIMGAVRGVASVGGFGLAGLALSHHKKDPLYQQFVDEDAKAATAPYGNAVPRDPLQLAVPDLPFGARSPIAPSVAPPVAPAPVAPRPDLSQQWLAQISQASSKSARKALAAQFTAYLQQNPYIKNRGQLYLTAHSLIKKGH